MGINNWVEERVRLIYEDAELRDVKDAICESSDPESRLIAAEDLNLTITLANRCLKPKQAAAICLLATGNAISHAEAARQAGITEVQLHRAIKWLRKQLESLKA